jgi:hypothetical protein
MTKAIRSVRSFSEIADFLAQETAGPSDDFAHCFTETVDGFRISIADEAVTSDLPDALQVQLATEMLVRTMFDVLRDTRLETLSDRLAWGSSMPSTGSPGNSTARRTRPRSRFGISSAMWTAAR